MSEKDRIAAVAARADVLFARISKAAAGAPRRPRIPGDGDGDGIPNEGKKPGGATARSTHYDSAKASELLGFTDPAKISDVARLKQMKGFAQSKLSSMEHAYRGKGRSVPLRYSVAARDFETHVENRIAALSRKG